MAKYTTQLRSIVESGTPIFDFDYPMFDEGYKSVLEQKIINTFYFREIGFETVAQFKHFLKARLNNIMPYYNQLYDSVGLVTKDDYNINLDNTITRKQTTNTTQEGIGEQSASSSGKGSGEEVYSDTPQARLQGKDYATNMSENKSTSSDMSSGRSRSEGNAKTVEEYTEHILGNGSMRYSADILMEWRKSFINVDQQILDELHDLFMGLY